MNTKKILSWLTSFAILGAYTGFLIFSDGHRDDGRAYAKDVVTQITVSAPATAPVERKLLTILRRIALKTRICILTRGKNNHCDVFILPFPIVHVS